MSQSDAADKIRKYAESIDGAYDVLKLIEITLRLLDAVEEQEDALLVIGGMTDDIHTRGHVNQDGGPVDALRKALADCAKILETK